MTLLSSKGYIDMAAITTQVARAIASQLEAARIARRFDLSRFNTHVVFEGQPNFEELPDNDIYVNVVPPITYEKIEIVSNAHDLEWAAVWNIDVRKRLPLTAWEGDGSLQIDTLGRLIRLTEQIHEWCVSNLRSSPLAIATVDTITSHYATWVDDVEGERALQSDIVTYFPEQLAENEYWGVCREVFEISEGTD